MEGGTSLRGVLRSGDFNTDQTAGYLDLDPLRNHAQRRSNRHFDGAFVVNTIFDLAGNGISNDVGIQFRATDLQDIDLHIVFACQLLQLFLDPVNFAATFTDDDARLASVNRYDQFIVRILDNDLRDPSLIDTGIQVSSDLVILDQLGSIIFFAAIPVGFPTTDDP